MKPERRKTMQAGNAQLQIVRSSQQIRRTESLGDLIRRLVKSSQGRISTSRQELTLSSLSFLLESMRHDFSMMHHSIPRAMPMRFNELDSISMLRMPAPLNIMVHRNHETPEKRIERLLLSATELNLEGNSELALPVLNEALHLIAVTFNLAAIPANKHQDAEVFKSFSNSLRVKIGASKNKQVLFKFADIAARYFFLPEAKLREIFNCPLKISEKASVTLSPDQVEELITAVKTARAELSGVNSLCCLRHIRNEMSRFLRHQYEHTPIPFSQHPDFITLNGIMIQEIQRHDQGFKWPGVRGERIQCLFEDDPVLLEHCCRQIRPGTINPLLVRLSQHPEFHSISDINAYTGDKLTMPLMTWIINAGIPVEVHATSTQASFAKLVQEGFTDIVEIPSNHAGTQKLIVRNPENGAVKVVFQCLPGESYCIQTCGPLLLYKIAGERRMPLDQLAVFTEPINYTRVYQDILKTFGVNHVDMVIIGNNAELKEKLQPNKPVLIIDAPYFHGSVYSLKGRIVFCCPISPYFFGDRSGHLVQALRNLGARNVVFTGTAGGLAGGMRLNQIVIPEQFYDSTDGNLTPILIDNTARTSIKTSGVTRTQRHTGVHSPITESLQLITLLKHNDIESVDCEIPFIGRALAGSEVHLHYFVRISDIPGTVDSIGMGGHSSSLPSEIISANQGDLSLEILMGLLPSESIPRPLTLQVAEHLKQPEEKEIEQLSKAKQKPKAGPNYLINAEMEIPDLPLEGAPQKRVTLHFSINIPGLNQDLIREAKSFFSKKVSVILKRTNGVVNEDTLDELQTLSVRMHQMYGIKIAIDPIIKQKTGK